MDAGSALVTPLQVRIASPSCKAGETIAWPVERVGKQLVLRDVPPVLFNEATLGGATAQSTHPVFAKALTLDARLPRLARETDAGAETIVSKFNARASSRLEQQLLFFAPLDGSFADQSRFRHAVGSTLPTQAPDYTSTINTKPAHGGSAWRLKGNGTA